MEQLTTIANLASLTLAALGLYYARRSAPAKELWAAAAMFLVAAAGQVVALCAGLLAEAGWSRLLGSTLFLTGLLLISWSTWGRADRATEATGETEGDLW